MKEIKETKIEIPAGFEVDNTENDELRDEFLSNFRPLIEKLKPLYGIK